MLYIVASIWNVAVEYQQIQIYCDWLYIETFGYFRHSRQYQYFPVFSGGLDILKILHTRGNIRDILNKAHVTILSDVPTYSLFS